MAAALLGAACAPPANAAGVWVRVSPTTVTAGYQTQVQAGCGENVNAATVTSPAFGRVTLQPVGGVLGATVPIPANTARGAYDVRLSCATGSQASTTLTVLNTVSAPGQAARGPDTGGGFLATNEAPPDRTPLVWVAVGVGCLLAAAAVALRTRPTPVRSRSPLPEERIVRSHQRAPEEQTGRDVQAVRGPDPLRERHGPGTAGRH